MFTEEEVGFRIYPQTGFLVDDPASASAKILPAGKDFQCKRTRNTLSNDQVQADGVEREFALGNHISKATGTLVCNFNFLGYLIKGISKTFSSVAFTGVYSTAVTNGGTGHTGSFLVTYTGGGGSGASGLAIVLGGTVICVVMINHGSGYATAPVPSFAAGTGTGTTGTAAIDLAAFLHTGIPGNASPVLWTIEKFAGGFYRRYFNMVLNKIQLVNTAEGICNIATDWSGSGHMKKASTPFDASPVEVTGTPGEYANLNVIEGGTTVGIVDHFTASIETTLKEKRPPNYGGKAGELRKGGTLVKLDGQAYFEDETFAGKMDTGTITDFRSATTSPDGIFNQIYPEAKMEVEDFERQDMGAILPFIAHSFKKTSSSAPATLQLINHTSSY